MTRNTSITKTTSRRAVLAAGLTALALTAVGCSAEPAGSEGTVQHPAYEAARGEGALTWYTSIDPDTAQSVARSFEETFPGVRVEVLRLTTGQIVARYAQERAAGTSPAEVVTVGDPDFFEEGKKTGWFEADPALENDDDWPSEFASEGVHLVSMIPIGVTYNTQNVTTPPTQWSDVLDAKYAGGRIQYGDPRNVPSYMQLFSVLRGEDDTFLTKVAGQAPVMASSVVNATQTVAAGGADLLITGTKPPTEIVKAQGAPIEYSPMSPTVGVEFYSGVASGPQNPNAALLFEDFMLSEKGQEVLNVNTVSPLGELPGTVPMPKDYKRIATADAKAQETQILADLGIQ